MANVWREPIFDRTSYDVAFALQQIAAWKQSHTHSSDVKVKDDKLVLNVGDITYVDGDLFVLQSGGLTQVENEVLILESGVVYDLKGCLNLSDIIRIEDNINYLSTTLTRNRYVVDVNSKEWTKDGLPTEQDMIRIGNNIRSIMRGFVTPNSPDKIPNLMLSYEDINTIERNLYLLKQLLDSMISSFIKSGAHRSGATTRLPIRR